MFKTLVVYNTSLCNLNCRYCFLSKNEAMKKLDKDLEKSFEDKDYYLNLAKEYCNDENLSSITRLEIWGGEPLLFLERVFNLIEQLIQINENFEEIMFSSNYTHKNVIPSFEKLINLLEKYPERKFKICSQISCDGPPDLNDDGRGEGVTEKILNNFNYLIDKKYFLKENSNIKIHLSLKNTLDKTNFHLFLDKDYNIKYYKWFEDNFIDKVHNSCKNITINKPIPNFAVPAEYTQEDGINLAKIVAIQREIEEENKNTPIFRFYKIITFFDKQSDNYTEKSNSYALHGGFCGTGKNMIGLLPNNQACGCHRMFSTYIKEYSNQLYQGLPENSTIISSQDFTLSNYLIFKDKQEADTHTRRMSAYYPHSNDFYAPTVLLSTHANQIKTLAYCGLVSEKYKDIEYANGAAKTLLTNVSTCITDNLIMCGTPMSSTNATFKLFCNGALDIIFGYNKGGE